MSTINLAVEQETTDGYPKFFRNGVVGVTVVLIVVLCLYGGLLYANKKIMAEIKSVDNQYTDEYNKFLAGNANDVIDFKNRSAISENLLNKNYPIKNIFSAAESSVLPTVYLESLSYDSNNKTVNLSCVAPGFFDVAKQVESFKQNEAFSSFALGKSAIDSKTGLINFDVILKMK
ncbi:MAG: hypothetical protein WC022_04410 [Parcubacteria group bacterium]